MTDDDIARRFRITPSRNRFYIPLREVLRKYGVIEVGGEWLGIVADEPNITDRTIKVLAALKEAFAVDPKLRFSHIGKDSEREFERALNKKPRTEWEEIV